MGNLSSKNTIINTTNHAAHVTSGITGTYKIYTIIADDATAMTDAADHRVDDSTGFKAFRISVIDLVNANTTNLAYGWSTDASDYAALETSLTAVLTDAATPDGAGHSNARIVCFVGDGTATKAFEKQDWVVYDGTNTIKTITAQVTGTGTQDIQVEVLV